MTKNPFFFWKYTIVKKKKGNSIKINYDNILVRLSFLIKKNFKIKIKPEEI